MAVAPLNFRDDDGDGLPDAWELVHFGGLSLQDGDDDADRDGASNLDEYYSMTHPVDADSRLAISAIRQSNGAIELEWTAAPWGRYRVFEGTHAPAARWQAVAEKVHRPSVLATERCTIPAGAAATTRVFRIEYLPGP